MAIATVHNWHRFQLFVYTTFLHGDINEEVYMKAPPGLDLSYPNLVRKLQRYLYGLKQASRQWNTKVTGKLISIRYIQPKANYFFTKISFAGFTIILVYVDDLVLEGTDLEEIRQLLALLNAKFSIKGIGVLKYFLGFEVSRNVHGISFCQRKNTLDLIHEASLIGAKPCNTPMQHHLELQKTLDTPISDPLAYRRLIWALILGSL